MPCSTPILNGFFFFSQVSQPVKRGFGYIFEIQEIMFRIKYLELFSAFVVVHQ